MQSQLLDSELNAQLNDIPEKKVRREKRCPRSEREIPFTLAPQMAIQSQFTFTSTSLVDIPPKAPQKCSKRKTLCLRYPDENDHRLITTRAFQFYYMDWILEEEHSRLSYTEKFRRASEEWKHELPSTKQFYEKKAEDEWRKKQINEINEIKAKFSK